MSSSLIVTSGIAVGYLMRSPVFEISTGCPSSRWSHKEKWGVLKFWLEEMKVNEVVQFGDKIGDVECFLEFSQVF